MPARLLAALPAEKADRFKRMQNTDVETSAFFQMVALPSWFRFVPVSPAGSRKTEHGNGIGG